MFESTFVTANLALAYATYALGTASPGPSNLSIMAIAMEQGRRAAMVFALGVVSGSTVWGFLAAFGLSAVLAEYSQALVAIKVLGGIYLLWLGFKSGRSAFKPAVLVGKTRQSSPVAGLYLRGALLHLTNPKAIFVWLSIVALALPPDAYRADALIVVAGCIPIGLTIFFSYALVFSTASAQKIYLRVRRWLDGTLGVLFAYAGIQMLGSRATL